MPLGKHLGADDDVDVARMNAIEQRLERPAPPRDVPIHPGDAQPVDSRFQRVGDPLGAEPETAHVPRRAFGTFDDQRVLRGAVVATKPPVAAMVDEARVAPPALGNPAASMAYEQGCIAAPVDEQERLLGPGLHLLERLDEHVAQAAVERPRPQVDHVDARRRRAAGTVRQIEPPVPAAPDVVHRLERGRRAAEHDRHAGVARAHHRPIARGVANSFLLLEGEIVLFVHDEEPRARERHEHRRTRPHDDLRRAVARMGPRREPFAVGEPGMECLHAAGKAGVKAREQLRGETDLGNEHERLAAVADHLFDEPQIHLRLAAAGHPLEHEGLERREVCPDRIHRALLIGVQDRSIVRPRRTRRLGDRLDPALRDQRPQRSAPFAMTGREGRFRDTAPGHHESEQPFLDRRPRDSPGVCIRAGRACRIQDDLLGLRRATEPQEPRQRARHDLSDGVLEVAARPYEQLEDHRIEQGLVVDDLAYPPQLRRVYRAVRDDVDHHPDCGRAPERHPDPHARTNLRRPPRLRGQVVELVADRHRHRDLEDGLGHRHRSATATITRALRSGPRPRQALPAASAGRPRG